MGPYDVQCYDFKAKYPRTTEVKQAEIEVNGQAYYVTHIPTATSGSWYVVHDSFETWGAVAIDVDGEVLGWKNPPKKHQPEIEAAIKAAFGL